MDDCLVCLAYHLTSIASIWVRTHQLNVHCAAMGHPIVADLTYGLGGDAVPNGGLDPHTLEATAPDRASEHLQKEIVKAANGMTMCIHSGIMAFRHPVHGRPVTVSSKAPF
mmetsp:Transcript_8510/g.19719  ORF Transcript_8510/g.19719 Transcript_8510/m.19719 type:complete len:111 (+) Transcript_8510:657-989(+)